MKRKLGDIVVTIFGWAGVIDKIYAGGYGNLTSKESGKIGGILAARNKAKKK